LQNCQPDTKESHTSSNPSLTPPPLIPISMLSSQNAKSKYQTNLSPPKLQRISKSDGGEAQTRNISKMTKVPSTNSMLNLDKNKNTWFPQTENEFLQSHDGTIPKPAQNIALMGGKRYIVVPKNNAMAVQPAITLKPDKIGDKPPLLQDGSLTDISNIVDNNVTKLRTPATKPLNTDLPENVISDDVISNKEISKDTTQPVSQTDFVSAANEMTKGFDDKNSKDNADISKKEESIEIISQDKPRIANTDCISEKKDADMDHESLENIAALVHTLSTADTHKENETVETNHQSLSTKAGTVTKIKNIR